MENLLTTKQAAEKLNVNPSRVRQLILAGRLPARKLGRDLFVNERDLDKVKDRRPGRPRKSPRDSLGQAKGGDPARLPVGKQSGGK